MPSYLHARMRLSVPINGLYLPFDKASDAIRRFCTPAMFHNDVEVYDVSAAGSTIRLRYHGRNLVLFTRHQLNTETSVRSPKSFVLPLLNAEGRRVGVGPNASATVKMPHEEHRNLEDLVIVEYDDVRGGRDLRPLFLSLDLDATLGTVPRNRVQGIFAIGYPMAFFDAEVPFDADGMPVSYDTISGGVKLYLDFADPAPLDTENRRPLVQEDKAHQMTIAPNGMSGAPVFFVWLDDAGCAHLSFAGLITDARPGRYMIYDAEQLKLVLDGYVVDP